MKNTLLLLSSILLVCLNYSCTKNGAAVPVQDASTLAMKQADASTTKYVLILRPGPNDGQDASVDYLQGSPSVADDNHGADPDLSSNAWTITYPFNEKFYIRFDSLVKIPSSAKIVSATLHFYGFDNGNLSQTIPQGNSVYPGSPYQPDYPDNTSYVQRVAGSWSASTITWNTQPAVDVNPKDSIPVSTSQWHYAPPIDVTDIVKKMVADPSTNFGFRIEQTVQHRYRCMVFPSSEYSDSTKRPKLEVIYKLQ